MRFTLVDRITEVHPGKSITAVKALSMAEEYLQDHFPRFPVMPGVLMLESLYQAGSWLVYLTNEYRHSAVLLKEARNVKYADFIQPGGTLTFHAEIIKQNGPLTTLKAQGLVGETVAVNGRLVLEGFNIGDRQPERAAWDAYARRELRKLYEILYRPDALS